MNKKTTKHSLKSALSHRSILWHAIVHSVALSTLIIAVLSGVSYVHNKALVEASKSAEIPAYEVARSAATMSQSFSLVGLLLLGVSVLLAYLFARRLTAPIVDIQTKVKKLKPGHWTYKKTVTTGDEAQALDTAFADLTKKLRSLYKNLEDKIAQRTDELARQYAKDRTILQSLSLGLLVVDTKGAITEANPAAAAILKMSQASLLGKNAVKLIDLHDGEYPIGGKEHPIENSLKTKKESHLGPEKQATIQCKDGERLPARISASPLLDGRKLTGAIVIFQDATMEREFDQMKTDFIALASHQLRTPLASVRWYLELMQGEDQKLSKEQEQLITEMRLAAGRMAEVVNDLMNASRLEQGGVTPVERSVELREFVMQAVNQMRTMSYDKKVSEIKLEAPDTFILQTDPVLLSVVLQNLLYNAVKYSKGEEGWVKVRVWKNKQQAFITVKDNGIGIPAADQAHVFRKLFRARNVRMTEANGSGLGLYSSKIIINKLGGELSFTSTEGEGTEFTLTLPLK